MTTISIPGKRVPRLMGVVLLGYLSLGSQAQTTWSSVPRADDSLEAARARFEADKKLCADESSAEARLQCRRDAQSVYDKALATNAARGSYSTRPTQVACIDCGRVTAVTVAEKAGDSNAVGMIAGGVAGAVLGHQVGGGFGKDLATVAGAVGGAYAGKKIQENMNARKVWTVTVTYTDGQIASFEFANDPGLSVGDTVRNSGTTVIRY
ncbi:glycine zipper 2TM domain-containing protein [Rhodoferax sp.]|uniref:glycine zipper 2TM domain-containing protein n=1 Tax=Rhodoferax sp. TaxID=50421 RepID=UPI00262B4AD9|nr:glycine zipper 2TM domain-containing protein [Rhodoferax sp.]MDD2923930.1 glycine zipper 2TM domain-containing protein [Rhodoferax sp.]